MDEKKKIAARIIADSINENGNRITSFVLTYPRFIHAELLTHRMFSRNAASSRAIPASKMIKNIEEDPFIPVAWQKAHSGMQGTEYFTDKEDIYGFECAWKDSIRDTIVNAKAMLKEPALTKQLVNRILEPYQWYTSIVTATEYSNWFELRCPQYTFESGYPDPHVYKSRKDFLKLVPLPDSADNYKDWTDLDWLKVNKGQGEIHISLLAEAMWDAMNESTPKQLKAGEWHIPFGDRFDEEKVRYIALTSQSKMIGQPKQEWVEKAKVKIATARCARVSYLNFEGKDDYEADIKLYDRLLKEGHYSPFEHVSRAMTEDEFETSIQGYVPFSCEDFDLMISDNSKGWSGNFRGFVQLRKEIE